MNKIYTVTIISRDANNNPDNIASWTFLDVNEQQEFLNYLNTLNLESNYEILIDEYFASTLEKAKQEVESFLGISTCMEDILEDDNLSNEPFDNRGDYNE